MAENERERVEALLKEATIESATALAELERQAGDKESRKAARRALYLLSMRGIRPTPAVLTGEALPDDPAPETLRAYASGFDGAGNRILFFEIAGPDGGKPTAVQMLVNDQTGLQTCDSARLDRRELRRRIQQLEQLPAEGLAFVEITPDYGRWLLEEARELLRRQNKPSPAGVLELLPRIGVPRHDYLISPVYDSISVETLNADEAIERDPKALFELTWFENWFFAVEDVLRALSDWENATDTLDASPDEKAAAERELIVREVTTDLFTPGVRTRYVRRLEETADILWRLSHTNEAKMALIHAQALAGDAPVAEAPFARALVERTLIAGLAVMKEKRAERARQG
jgi:hypothetical protein